MLLFFHLVSGLCLLRCVDREGTSVQDSENFHFIKYDRVLCYFHTGSSFQALSISAIVSQCLSVVLFLLYVTFFGGLVGGQDWKKAIQVSFFYRFFDEFKGGYTLVTLQLTVTP
jgi:outer membrane receptor for Fe3+-dicitrate